MVHDGSSMFHSCFVLAKATCGITALAAPAPPRRSTSLLDVEGVAVEGVARRATLVTLATLPSAAAKPSSATPLTPLTPPTPLPLAQELPPNGARERVGASLGAGAGQDAKVKATAIGSGGARVTLQLSQASHKTYFFFFLS